jgi:hypothetical protein
VGVILRSRRRRRISQVIDSLAGEILRFAQNDTAEHFFSNLLGQTTMHYSASPWPFVDPQRIIQALFIGRHFRLK